MKPLNRFIKGILIRLAAIMVLNLGLSFAPGLSSALAPATVYAQDGDDEAGEDADTPTESASERLEKVSTPSKTPEEAQTASDLLHDVAVAANKTHRLFAPLINFFAFKIGGFLGTDYVYGGAMGKMLQKIWVISRNLVNIFFVFILLWLALNTVFNPKFTVEEMGKKLLFFVLFLVAINFSWLGAKVILDASNVATYAVFAIPSGISDPPTQEVQCQLNGPEESTTGPCYPTAIIAPADSGVSNPIYWEKDQCEEVKEWYGGYEGAKSDAAYDAKGKKNPTIYNEAGERISGASEKNAKLQGRMSICMENLDLFDYDQNTAVIYLTYGMARIQNLVTTVGSPQPGQLAVSVLLSLAIQLAYTISLLALFIALVVRMAMLWLFVGFSPFLVLILYFAVGEGKNPFEEIKDWFSFEAFLSWAFVPAKVGAVFVVAFIMISAGQAMGDIDIRFLDKLSSESGMTVSMPEVSSLFGGIGTLQNFIWLLMTLAILWMGVFAVLNKMKIAGTITKMIGDYGSSTAKYIATLPIKAPVLPLGKGGEKISAAEAIRRSPLNVKGRIVDYTGELNERTAVDALNKRAGSTDFAKVASEYNSGLDAPKARKIAVMYGFSSVEEMFRKHDDKVLKSAFRGTKNFSSHGISEDDLLGALKKYSKPETASERAARVRQEAQATATAEQAAGVLPKSGEAAAGGTSSPKPGAGPAQTPPAAKPPAGTPPAK